MLAAALALVPAVTRAQGPPAGRPSADGVAAPLSAYDLAALNYLGSIALSPDGGLIAYRLDVPRRIGSDEDGAPFSQLHVVDAGGRSRPFVAGEVDVRDVAWRPDGGAISFIAKRGTDESDGLYLIPTDGGEARRLLSHPQDVVEHAWSPDGKRIAFLARPAKPERRVLLEESGFTQEVFEEDWLPVQLWMFRPSASEGGTEEPPQVFELPGSASALSWSPAGDRLAVALAPTPLVDDRYMRRTIHLVDPDSGGVVGRVEHQAKLGETAWSPDGAWLAFVAGADLHDPQEGRLLMVPAGGGEPAVLIGEEYAGHVTAIGWLDAERLVFVGEEGLWAGLFEIDRQGGEPRPLLPLEGPAWWELEVAGATLALRGETPEHPPEAFLWRPAGGEAPVRLTDSNPWLAERRLAPQEAVRWTARDGLALEGLLIRPLDGVPNGALDGAAGMPAPLVLMVHGGPEAHFSNGWLSRYSRPAQVLAGRGIASFFPNYRGSTGRGVAFSKLGQGDAAGPEFDDLIDAVDHLVAAGIADRSRVGITGGSYGGYATAWGATRLSERFAAGVMFNGVSDNVSKLGTSDIPHELHLVHARRWPWEDWQFALERSPIYHLEKARTPLLILHGENDTRVFPGQSLALYRYLKLRGQAPVRLVRYPGEKHGNRRAASRLDLSLRLVRWMEHYLIGPGGEPPPWELAYEGVILEEEAAPADPAPGSSAGS